METCYTNLANAIILAAAKDHRRARNSLNKKFRTIEFLNSIE